ncbi:putative sulfate/molybdate transporter [Dichotomicrobium thermohalophilum]|uniref:MFS superfamily molybdate transporter n=1 Tax=Dichotomicrobium thermohalophilum TaxID=933063 RepID=A0A397Q4Z0_9HYPH|nr:putative sulfate/molybdate transporter [Dichotomicrobium thermohalophilum]RIA56013.1 MFS superfamily molybdate transporter [Dichotomicrobium thermohalophilum]
MTVDRGTPYRWSAQELSGALGDLGTLLPLALGAIAVAGLAPAGVLAGFGLFYVATALIYRLPVPVQPMKAMAAIAMTGAVTPAMLAAGGVLTGVVLLVLGLTGLITRFARIVPQSIIAGLQLGLGLALGAVALELMAGHPAIGGVVLAVLALMFVAPKLPTALLGVAVAIVLGQVFGVQNAALGAVQTLSLRELWPSVAELEGAVSQLVLPQLALTLTNAVLLTALIAGDYFGKEAEHVTTRRLATTSGLANIALAPFGALPMCHGAGGLAAHYRFGARSGAAPLILGLAFLGLALAPAEIAAMMFAAIPAAGLGALLLFAAGELAISKRLFDSRPSCWPVIAITAGVTAVFDPFWGLLVGGVAESIRALLVRLVFGHRTASGP